MFILSTPWPVFLVSKTFKEPLRAPPYKETLPIRLQFCNVCRESYLPPFPPYLLISGKVRKDENAEKWNACGKITKENCGAAPAPLCRKSLLGKLLGKGDPGNWELQNKNFKDNFGCDRWAFTLRMPHVQGDFGIKGGS